jgi:hypothetical protein
MTIHFLRRFLLRGTEICRGKELIYGLSATGEQNNGLTMVVAFASLRFRIGEGKQRTLASLALARITTAEPQHLHSHRAFCFAHIERTHRSRLAVAA